MTPLQAAVMAFALVVIFYALFIDKDDGMDL